MILNASGNLGIGTDNPTNMLDIAGSTPTIELNDTDTGVIHRVNANSGVGIFYFDSDINNVGSDGSFVFRHGHLGGGSQVFSISSVGTLTLGPNSGKIRRSGDIDTYINFDGSDDIEFVTGNVERLRIASSGNVGIGTDNPSAAYKLHVSDVGGTIALHNSSQSNTIRYANNNTTAEWSAGTSRPGLTTAGNYYSITQYGTDGTWRERFTIDSGGLIKTNQNSIEFGSMD